MSRAIADPPPPRASHVRRIPVRGPCDVRGQSGIEVTGEVKNGAGSSYSSPMKSSGIVGEKIVAAAACLRSSKSSRRVKRSPPAGCQRYRDWRQRPRIDRREYRPNWLPSDNLDIWNVARSGRSRPGRPWQNPAIGRNRCRRPFVLRSTKLAGYVENRRAQRVESVSAGFRRPHDAGVVAVMFRDREHASVQAAAAVSHGIGQLAEKGPARLVIDCVGRVEPQGVDMKLAQPVNGIADKKIAYRIARRTVEVDRRSPGRAMPPGEVGRNSAR